MSMSMRTMKAGCRVAGRAAVLLLLIAAGSAPVMAKKIGNVYGPALQAADGEQIYTHICRGCHMPKGRGAIGAGELFFALPVLSDGQVAAVTNYVRTHFGNHYSDSITAAEVEALQH